MSHPIQNPNVHSFPRNTASRLPVSTPPSFIGFFGNFLNPPMDVLALKQLKLGHKKVLKARQLPKWSHPTGWIRSIGQPRLSTKLKGSAALERCRHG